MIFSRKRKDVFIAQNWFENRVSLYTAALTSNKIAPILFEGGGGCCTQAIIAFDRFLILQYTGIFSSHGIFGFLPLYHTKVRWTLTTVPDSIVGSHVYRKFSILPPSQIFEIVYRCISHTVRELILALGPTPPPRRCECVSGFIIGVVVAVVA